MQTTAPLDVLARKEFSQGPCSQTKNYGQLGTAARRRIAFPRDEAPDWLSNTKWPALKLYTCRQH